MAQIKQDAIQLQPLKAVPTLLDLINLLAWLSDCQETYMLEHTLDSLKQVLLPWMHGGSGELFALGISISKKLPDELPIWTFYKNLEPEPQVQWAYATHDASLIHNMLLCFFPDESFTRAEKACYANLPPMTNDSSRNQGRQNAGNEQMPFLQGSIQKLQLDCLLQSLASSRITGKLAVSSEEQTGLIFFEDGTPVHCSLNGEEGHDAILQLLTWEGGDFDVFSDERAPKRSITKRMEGLLMEGAALLDYGRVLAAAGITEKTVLEKVPMSSFEYEQRMKDTPPVAEKVQNSIASLLDNSTSVEEVVTRLGLTKPIWMPAIFGFVRAGVVRVSDVQETARVTHQKALKLCASQIGMDGILDDQTGLYTAAAFHLFSQLELARCQAHRNKFSIVLLRLLGKEDDLLDVSDYCDCIRSIELLCRPADLLCHYKPSTIGLILPGTSRAAAEVIADRIEKLWARSAISTEADSAVTLSTRIASYPDDSKSIDQLLRVLSGARPAQSDSMASANVPG